MSEPVGRQAEFMGKSATVYDIAMPRPIIQIGYTDKHGQVTTRTIMCFEVIDQDEKTYVGGFCVARKDFRHFHMGRIAWMKSGTPPVEVNPFAEAIGWISR